MLDLFHPPKIQLPKRKMRFSTPRYSVSRAKLTREEYNAKKAAAMRMYRAKWRDLP